MKRLAALFDDLSDLEKVLYPGLLLLSLGCALWWFPAALMVPGGILVFIALRANPDAMAALGDLEEEEA